MAIFVTSNQYNVLDTIRSRCQIIRLQYEESNSNSFNDEILSFIDDINKRKSDDLLLKFNYYSSNFFKDKSLSTDFIRDVLKYYKSLLNKEDNAINLEEVINIVSILDEKLKKLKYNVNIKLWIDDLLLSLMEV